MTDRREPDPCPFCKTWIAALSPGVWQHPNTRNGCVLSLFKFRDRQIAAWNTRAPADGWQGIETAQFPSSSQLLRMACAALDEADHHWRNQAPHLRQKYKDHMVFALLAAVPAPRADGGEG